MPCVTGEATKRWPPPGAANTGYQDLGTGYLHRMLRRLETGDPIDLLDVLFADERRGSGRPWVMLNMVTSVDGATALRGGATALNDADDRALFLALRSVADVVLVGAQTVRSENLGPIRMSEEMRGYRRAAGLDGDPRLAILTRSFALDLDDRVFSDPSNRPIVVTSEEADQERVAAIGDVADVFLAAELDGEGIVGAFGDVGVILCEGGPTVNSQLIAADLVDEINLTVSPMFALGASKRVALGPELDPPIELNLDRGLLGTRSLFLRYVRE